ncbi:beta-ketoacyl synthase N-terminal-like domain-containing protein, partial [Kitasatospora sp. NPDC093558]|uniref:beta-ketoacyl synthase N-terminal-like domain-containing protein n=1 Tax=Kitasatospora sp. NPDC093558 TaxID=3155201 RepID=UPI00343D64BD
MADTGRHPAPRRVVITGCGLISPIGHSVPAFWAAATTGTTGVKAITGLDTALLPTRFAGEVTGFDPLAHMPNRVARRLDRYAQFALAAAQEAMAQAGLADAGEHPERTAVSVGTGYGPGLLMQSSILDLHRKGRRRINPYLATGGSLDSAAGEIAVRFGAHGPSTTAVTACATGATSIGEALRMIRHGYADVVIAGGADDAVNP